MSKFHIGDYVDFWHKDDVFFGTISDLKISDQKEVFYDIDIAGQCPTTLDKIPEEKVIRIHKN